jgi:16S rRNA (uracil1498-N3)-methyltransferase
MQLYYSPYAEISQTVSLDENESHHITKVMRMQIGDHIQVCNGRGSLYEAVISGISKHNVQISIEATINSLQDPESRLHIAISPTKNISRFEWFLEKATEIGIAEITPIISENSERNVIKPERLEKIIISAMKQSKHLFKPILHPICQFSDFLTKNQSKVRCIAYCEDLPDNQLFKIAKPNQSTTVLIGPEGDFSQDELQMAKVSGYQPVALGNNRLRTETAGIVACQIIQDVNLS